MIANIYAGESLSYDETTLGSSTGLRNLAIEALTPLAVKDMYDALRAEGMSRGLAIGMLAIFGAGVQIYD